MQLIRHGTHISGQRTDAGRLDSATPEPRQGRGHQQGVSSRPPQDVRGSLRPMCRTTSTRPSKALGTDFIDLYLLHYDHPTARVEPVMEQLNRHIDEGKISAIGASNWSHERIAQRQHICRRQGPATIWRVERSIQPC